jgi:hypothetical protein
MWQAEFLQLPALRSIIIFSSYLEPHPQHQAFREALLNATTLDQDEWRDADVPIPDNEDERLHGTDIPLVRHISALWTAIADIAVRIQDLSTSCAVIEVDMSSLDDFTLDLADTAPTKSLYTTCAT